MSDFFDLDELGDLQGIERERGEFELLPPGDYVVQAVEASTTRKPNGNGMVKITFEVITGPHTGRKVFENLNVRHSNPVAQRIGLEAFAELWRAMGETSPNPSHPDNLLFKPVVAVVKVTPAKGEYEARNQVKRYKPVNGAAPPATKAAGPAPAPRPAPAAAAAAAPQAGNRPSWLAKKTA